MKKILIALLLIAVTVFSLAACKAEVKEYTVSFDSDGGSSVAAETVKEGEKATEPTAPTKEGYTFAGWYVGEEKYDFASAVTADVALKASWSLNKYTVTFDADNGSDNATATVEHGATVAAPAETPEKEGYIFDGWFVGDEEYDFSSAVTADLTVKAQWTAKTYIVTFDPNGGSSVDEQTVKHGETATKPTDPVLPGFALSGWFVGDAEYDFATPVTGDVTLRAEWVVDLPDLGELAGTWTGVEQIVTVYNSYEIVIAADGTITGYYDNGNTEVTITVNYVIYENGTLTVNYSAASAENENMVFTVSQDKGILTTESAAGTYPLELRKNYTVTFDWGNYEDEVDPKLVTVKHGDTVNAPTKSWSGHEIKAWLVDDAAFDFDTPITSDMTLVANWGVKQYAVTFYDQNGEELKVVTVNHGETVPVGEIPTEGITKVAGAVHNGFWYGTAKSNVVVDVVNKGVTGNKNCYPGIIEPLADIDGIWKGSDNKGAWVITVDAEEKTVTATLGTETLTVNWFRFQTLDGKVQLVVNYTSTSTTTSLALTWDSVAVKLSGGTSSNPLVLKRQGDVIYTVTFDSDGGSAVEAETVAEGATVQLPAAPTKQGFTFAGWFVGDAEYDFASPVNGDLTLTAKWIEDAPSVIYSVIFDLGYDNKIAETKTVNGGSAVDAVANPSRSNYTFLGWYLGDAEYDFSAPVNGDITLVAKWKGVAKKLIFIKQDGTKIEFSGEYGKTIEQNITENYEDIMAAITGASADSVVRPATFEEMKANLVNALRSFEGSYHTGLWTKGANSTTLVNFSDVLSSASYNISANFIAPIFKELVGTWTCEYNKKQYEFTFSVTTDSEGNITGVTAEGKIDGVLQETYFVKTYYTSGATQIIIRYTKSGSTSLASFTIKQVITDAATGAYVWQYSNTDLVKK